MSRYPRSPVRWFHSPESVRGRRAIAVPPRRRVFDRYEPHRVQWMLPREILAHQSDLLRNDRRAGARSERQCSPWISSKGSNQTSSRRAPRPSGLGPHRRLPSLTNAADRQTRHRMLQSRSAGTPPFHGRRKPNGSACRRRTMAGVQHEAENAMSAISPLKSCEVEKPQPQERAGIGSTRRASCNIATWLVALGVKRFPVSPSAFPSARPPLAIVCRVRRGLF
jgi:hypothetical protein